MSLNKTIRDIKNLRIQGATAVACEALKALADYGHSLRSDGHKYILAIDRAANSLAEARAN